MKSTLIAAAILLGSTTLALAQTGTPRIDARQANQHQRIHNGVASGELSHREAKNLRRGQIKIQRMENRAKADGVVTPRERARIRHAQNVESRKIMIKKHN